MFPDWGKGGRRDTTPYQLNPKLMAAWPKPFLGGYRHKRTGAEYHHACAQTDHKKKAPKDVCSMYYRVTH